MSKALLILDVQKGFVTEENSDQLEIISTLMKTFKNNKWPIVAFQHVDTQSGSSIEKGTEGAELVPFVQEGSDVVLEKKYPIAYKETQLQDTLQDHQVKEVYIVGFNMEYCVLFTAVTSADRGYRTVVVEDACGTVNNEETYEMEGLDIIDFVGSVLDWSGVVEDVYYDELEL